MGTETRAATMTDEMEVSIPDLTTTSHWALVTTGATIPASGLSNAATLNIRFHWDLQPSFACLTSGLPFSFALEVVW